MVGTLVWSGATGSGVNIGSAVKDPVADHAHLGVADVEIRVAALIVGIIMVRLVSDAARRVNIHIARAAVHLERGFGGRIQSVDAGSDRALRRGSGSLGHRVGADRDSSLPEH